MEVCRLVSGNRPRRSNSPPRPPLNQFPRIPQTEFEQLIAAVREARPKDDLAPIEKAYQFAAQYHSGQKRASGEPYMSHPLAVASILAGMRMDVVSIETGLLHDIVEDTTVTSADIQKNFGAEVAALRRWRHQTE